METPRRFFLLPNGTALIAQLTGWDATRITARKGHLAPMRDAAQTVLDAQKALDDAAGALGATCL